MCARDVQIACAVWLGIAEWGFGDPSFESEPRTYEGNSGSNKMLLRFG